MEEKNTGLSPLPTYADARAKFYENPDQLTPFERMVFEWGPMGGPRWREHLSAALQQAFDEGMAVAAQQRQENDNAK